MNQQEQNNQALEQDLDIQTLDNDSMNALQGGCYTTLKEIIDMLRRKPRPQL